MQEEYTRIVITDNSLIASACQLLLKQDIVAVDTETTSLNPYQGRLRLLQVAAPQIKQSFAFDLDHITDVEPIRQFLLSPVVKLMYNGAFDAKFCLLHLSQGLRRVYPENVLDLMFAAQLLSPFGGDRKIGAMSLKDALEFYLQIEVDKQEQKSDWSRELRQSQIDYAFLDVELLPSLADVLGAEIDALGMQDAWRVENRCLLATAMMEIAGMHIDLPSLSTLQTELFDKMRALELRIGEYLPRQQMNLFWTEPVNLSSSAQVKPKLIEFFTERISSLDEKQAKEYGFYRTFHELKLIGSSRLKNVTPHSFVAAKGDECTCKLSKLNPVHIDSKKSETIKQYRPIAPELVDILCDYATIKQAYTTYCIGLPRLIMPETGKLHANLFQLGQPQHRYMARRPNLLNIPKTIKIGPDAPQSSLRHSDLSFRECFKALKGRKLIIADYDSLQAKLTAARANESKMIRVMQEDEAGTGPDFHTATGMFITGKGSEEVKQDKTVRSMAKSLNFAVIFGAGPQRLQDYMLDSFGLVLSLKEAAKLRDKYFEIYPELAAYHNAQRERVKQEARIYVKGGRMVLLEKKKAESLSYTVGLNFPAVLAEQSGMKRALGELARYIIKHEVDANIVLSVYDEIIIECAEDVADFLLKPMQEIMISSMQRYVEHEDVRITCEAKAVNSWSAK